LAERRQLSIVYVDIVGSTPLSESLDPEDFFAILRDYHRTCEEIVVRFGGHVAQQFGDGLLAFFCLPHAHEDDPERAVHAALAIAAMFHDRDFTTSQDKATRLAVRIAVNTGLVVAGSLTRRFDLDRLSVFGKPTHMASRLQELAPHNGVVVAQVTYELIRGAFHCEFIGEHALKGIKNREAAWLVKGPAESENRFARHDAPPLTPMVGRASELSTLRAMWARSEQGTGSVVVISGEPGIGKSRLLQTFRVSAGIAPRQVVSMQCSPLHLNTPLSPLLAHTRRVARLGAADTPLQSINNLKALFAENVPDLDQVLRYYAAALSIPAHDDFRPADLSSPGEREKALATFARMPILLSRRAPIFVLVEDVQWIDPTSIEVLQRLIAQVHNHRILVAITHRSDDDADWLKQSGAEILPLARLEPEECSQMVVMVAGALKVPRAALEWIVDRTDGVPLFVEEFTRTVLDASVFRRDGDQLFLDGSLPEPLVPSTLQDALMERLDRLGDAKRVAQEASVFGRHFSYRGLRHLSRRGRDQTTRLLGQLETLGLLRREGVVPEATFTFKHAMIQEVAYSSLLKEERSRLHARAAAWSLQAAVNADSGDLAVLGHHYFCAGLTTEAVDAWLGAGKSALGRSANKEAAAHLRQALDLVPRLSTEQQRIAAEIELQSALAMALTAREGWSGPQVGHAYDRALTLCRDHGTIRQRSIALWGVTTAKLVGAQLAEALQYAQEFVALAESCGNDEVGLMAHTALLIANFFTGRLPEARASVELVCARYNPALHSNLVQVYQHDPKIMALIYAGHIHWLLGQPERARESCAEARRSARQLGHPFMLIYALILGASDYLYDNDLEAGRASIQEGMKLAREHRLGMYETFAPLWAIEAVVAERPGLNTVERLTGLIKKLLENDCYLQAPLYLVGVAEEFARLGQAERARELVADAEAVMRRTGERWFEPEVFRVSAMLQCLEPAPDHERAILQFRRALDAARHLGAVGWELRAALSFAKCLGHFGWRAEAQAAIAAARAKFARGESSPDLRAAEPFCTVGRYQEALTQQSPPGRSARWPASPAV
jgi:class 3 adenylate cyclase/predicted ATPase/ABC-type transport system involved in cytochrome c biogenesis ATPase subunit